VSKSKRDRLWIKVARSQLIISYSMFEISKSYGGKQR